MQRLFIILAGAALVTACSSGAEDSATADTGSSPPDDAGAMDAGTGDSGGGGGLCQSCLSTTDCPAGFFCVQIGGSDRCAHFCNAGSCPTGQVCAATIGMDGRQQVACLPANGSCTGPGCGTCGQDESCDYAAGRCIAAAPDGGNDGGQPHNDAGHPQDGGRDAGNPQGDAGHPQGDAGSDGSVSLPPITGTVDHNGGSVSRLFFAVTGDTRPDKIDDVAGYPTALVTKIYDDLQGMSPQPQFVVATGDFMFSGKSGTTAAQQIAQYKQGMKGYNVGPMFPVLGNHECDGYTTGNCSGKTTGNYTAYMQGLVQPLGKTKSYYSLSFGSSVPSFPWTAKIVVVACNDWDSAQRSWLSAQLATPTTYTIVARHESTNAEAEAPCVADVDPLLSSHPVNLLLVGHTHTFEVFRRNTQYNPLPVDEIVVGIGGAQQQLNPGQIAVYGYATVEQVADGFKVTEYSADDPEAPLFTFLSKF